MNPFTSAKAPQSMAVLPPDMAVQQQQLDRQKLMAEMLRKQALEPGGGTEMVSGWAVQKSPMEGAAKLAQALSGRYLDKQNDEKQAELTRASGKQLADTLAGYQSDMQGKPAQTFQTGANEMGDEPATQNVAAVPPNKQAALARLLQSGNPMLQQIGMQQILKGEEVAKFGLTPQYDQQGNAFVLNERGERKMLDGVKARDKMEVAPSGVAFNPYAVQPGAVFNDPNKLMSIGPDGQPVVNQQLVGVKKEIGKAGATNVNVKTDVKMGESLGAQVGPMMKDSTSIAEGAVKQVDAAQRIVKAIDSDKTFAGPLANTRVKVAQVSQMLGVGGKDEAEKLANTRAAMRGLAELTLQGRQQMKGQGAITESEGALAEKAMSGNIEDLTGAEIKQLAKASERAARFNYAEHQRKLKVMEANPSLSGVAPFYQGPAMAPEAAPPGAPATGGFKILGVK